MFINAVVEHGDALSIRETAILRAPARTVPSVAVSEQALEDLPGYFAVGHQAVQMFVQVGLFMDLKVM